MAEDADSMHEFMEHKGRLSDQLPRLNLGDKRDAGSENDSEHSWELLSIADGDSPRSLPEHEQTPVAAQLSIAVQPETPAVSEEQLLSAAPAATATSARTDAQQPDSPTLSCADSEDSAALDVYSLSQEGSIDGCSDISDTHLTNELMAQAEPDHRADFDSSSIEDAKQAEEADAAAVPESLWATISQELSELSAKVQAYADAGMAAASDMTNRVWNTMQEWLEAVQVRLSEHPGLAPLKLLGEELADVGHRVKTVIVRLVQHADSSKGIDWAKLVLGTGCVALAVLYWKSKSANKALATRLAVRDAELAELVGSVLKLRHRSSVPIIRPVACTTIASWGPVMHMV